MKHSALIAASVCFLLAGAEPDRAQQGAPPSPLGAGVLCNTCYLPLSVSTTSTPVAIPAASPPYNALTLKNKGPSDAYFAQGNSSVVALLTSPILHSGDSITVLVSGGYLAAITQTGTTQIDVYQSNASVLLQANGNITIAPAPVSAGQSTVTENAHVFCTGPCNVYSIGWPSCPAGDWAMLFDATSAPVDGAVTPAWYGQSGLGLFASWEASPRPMTTGAVAVCSSTGPFTKTTVASTFVGQAH